MFRWLKSRALASSLKSETERTLRDVLGMPEDMQRTVALEVVGEIFRALGEIEKTPGPSSPERDDVIRNQLERAKARRHLAIERGARDGADPRWATAVLIEGWLLVNAGTFGRDAFNHVDGLTMGWARSVLTDDDFEQLEASEAE